MGSLIQSLRLLFANALVQNECKMVLVVRTDIPMGKGKVASQCAHAALQCYRQASASRSSKQALDAWLLMGQPKIVVRISGESELLNLARSAAKASLVTAIIRDAGRTQVKSSTITVLGIGPGPKTIIDDLTSNLKLL